MGFDAHVRRQVGALDLDARLTAAAGDVVALVGPNGAGKSTLLKAVAEGRDDVGLVFQDRLLFPHLSALDNVAFGLRRDGWKRAKARQAALAWLDQFGLADAASLRPHALSGGQAARVALARALARSPRVLLLDEPFAGVDVEAQADVRRAVRAAATGERVTVLVTHQPVDVLALATQVVVLEDGRVTQAGSFDEVRSRPRSPWVARMAGVNLLRGTAVDGGLQTGDATVAALTSVRGDAFAVVHPRSVVLSNSRPDTSARNAWPGRVDDVDHEGDRVRVRVRGPVDLVAEITPAALAELGSEVWASVKATDVEVYPA